MKKIYVTLFLGLFVPQLQAQYAALNFTLVSQLNPENGVNSSGDTYSGCWGWYQTAKNKEYAIACSKSGTYWVDVTNPFTPTVSAFAAGTFSDATWREVKTYQNYCYIVSDDGGSGPNNSFQIFDMQYLPDSVHKVHDSKSILKRGHTLWVDGNKLYVSSVTYSNNGYSPLNVYSLATPSVPVLLRELGQDAPFINGVHDAFVRNDTVYASCEFQGLYVFKLTSNNTFQQLGSLTSYPSAGYNHSSALTPDGNYLLFTDEVNPGLPFKVTNVTNLNNMQVVATANQFTATTPHNPFMVSNQYCFLASYKDGVQLYDISSPATPSLAGYFDTYPQGGGNTGNWGQSAFDNYKGLWGLYPYLPSKTIFALDMNNGLFFLRTPLYANPTATAGFNTVGTLCVGNTTTFVNTSTAADNYTWTFSGGIASTTLQTPTVAFANPGVYTVTLVANNLYSSSTASQTVNVVANSLVASTSGSNLACASCTGAVAVAVSGGYSPYSYNWQPGGASTSVVRNLAMGCYTVTVKDAMQCKKTESVCIGAYTGLNEGTYGHGFSLYPNPAASEVHVRCSGQFDCRLYDLSGRLLASQDSQNDLLVLPLNGYTKGIYLLEVNNASEKSRQKLVIE